MKRFEKADALLTADPSARRELEDEAGRTCRICEMYKLLGGPILHCKPIPVFRIRENKR